MLGAVSKRDGVTVPVLADEVFTAQPVTRAGAISTKQHSNSQDRTPASSVPLLKRRPEPLLPPARGQRKFSARCRCCHNLSDKARFAPKQLCPSGGCRIKQVPTPAAQQRRRQHRTDAKYDHFMKRSQFDVQFDQYNKPKKRSSPFEENRRKNAITTHTGF